MAADSPHYWCSIFDPIYNSLLISVNSSVNFSNQLYLVLMLLFFGEASTVPQG